GRGRLLRGDAGGGLGRARVARVPVRRRRPPTAGRPPAGGTAGPFPVGPPTRTPPPGPGRPGRAAPPWPPPPAAGAAAARTQVTALRGRLPRLVGRCPEGGGDGAVGDALRRLPPRRRPARGGPGGDPAVFCRPGGAGPAGPGADRLGPHVPERAARRPLRR